MKKLFLIIIFIAGLAGLVDSIYLTVEHYNNAIVPCTILNGCGTVLNSAYANIGPIPMSLVGIVFYLAMLTLTILSWKNSQQWLKKLWLLSLIAFVFTLYLIYLQIFVLQALCIYCLASATMVTMMFLLLNFLVSEKPKIINAPLPLTEV